MKKFSILFMVLIVMFSVTLGGCDLLNNNDDYTDNGGDGGYVPEETGQDIEHPWMSVAMVDDAVANGGYILLSVDTVQDYDAMHIATSINVPLSNFSNDIVINIPDHTEYIGVYATAGRDALDAANTMVNLGYTNVYFIGGANRWDYSINVVTGS